MKQTSLKQASLFLTCLACLNLSFVSAQSTEVKGNDTFEISAKITPITSGGTETIAQPDEVSVQKADDEEPLDTVKAASPQDALNKTCEEFVNGSLGGCIKIVFPSGEGYCAVGTASYEAGSNIDYSRLSKRNAFVKAYLNAKSQLAKTLGQVEVQNNINYLIKKDSVITKEQTREMSTEEINESVKTTVSTLLRSHIIYKIIDDKEYHSVSVAIFSTPATENAITRNSDIFVDAKDLTEGIAKITEEVFSGVTPPVGGKIVTIPGTRAIALVSYGSAPIFYAKDKYKQRRNQYEASQKAEAYAQAAMLNLIKGERIDRKYSTMGIDNISSADYEDAIENASAQNVGRMEEQNAIKSGVVEIQTSSQSGILPAGISSRSWIDKKNGWVYIANIYIPKMKEAEPVLEETEPIVEEPESVTEESKPVVKKDIKEATIKTGTITNPSDF